MRARWLTPLLVAVLFVIGCKKEEAGNCDDDKDNDKNGFVDCEDVACAADPVCPAENCATPGDENGNGAADCQDVACAADPRCTPESDCQDNQDNDLDGQIDCRDADCAGNIACPPEDCDLVGDEDDDGFADCQDADCANDPRCLPEANCQDNQDNDFDGETDCADSDCVNSPSCDEGARCADGVDNDLDGLLDCADDVDCASAVNCIEAGVNCSDNTDNDLDGLFDCADPDCANEVACQPVCGNGAIEVGEACDDGNTTNGDCCDAACQPEGNCEVEPNDDGAVAVNTNDFLAANANGPFSADALLTASINPAGDDDVFALLNPTSGVVKVRIDTFNPSLGVDVACGTTMDTFLRIRDAAGASLATNDDRNGSADQCSGLETALAPGETRFAQLTDFGDNDPIALYLVRLVFTPVVCGDNLAEQGEVCDGADLAGQTCVSINQGFLSGTLACNATCDGFDTNGCVPPVCGDGILTAANNEACDDGNTNDGDGCSGACAEEPNFVCSGQPSVCFPVVDEIEPNEDGTPQTGGGGTNGNDFDAGGIAVSNALNNGAFDTLGGEVLLAAALNPAGDEDVFAVINTDSNRVILTAETFGPGGVGTCTGLDTEVSIRNSAAAELANDDDGGVGNCSLESFVLNPGETLFVHVIDFGDSDIEALYLLQLRFTPVICGDVQITAGLEQCDDGNQNPGDGCSDLCQVEPAFACNNTSLPSVCTFLCGNGIIGDGLGEACDDGNNTNGDGCDGSLCEVEPDFVCNNANPPSVCVLACGDGIIDNAGEQCDPPDGILCDGGCQVIGFQEVEPNEDGTPQTGGSGFAGNDFDASGIAVSNALNNGVLDAVFGDNALIGSLQVAGDEDVFALTNSGPNSFSLEAEIFTDSIGACGSDTGLNLRNAQAQVLASDDDSGVNNCSLITGFLLTPGSTVFVHVTEFGDNEIVPLYFVRLTLTEVVCGNTTIEAGEECDDGNTVDGDGCSSDCQVEFAVCGVGQTLVQLSSVDVPKTISDNATVTSVIVVPDVGSVARVVVGLDSITHTFDGDLDITLLSPVGTAVELSSDNGGTGENYLNTVFDDNCLVPSGPITAGAAPFTGCFSPEVALAGFSGDASNGTWTLQISDDAGGDTGSLNAWTLGLCLE